MGLLQSKIIEPPQCAITYCRDDATTTFADLWNGDGHGQPAAIPVCEFHERRFATWLWAQRVKPAPHQFRYAAELGADWSEWKPLEFVLLLPRPARRFEFKRLVTELGPDARALQGVEITKNQGPHCSM